MYVFFDDDDDEQQLMPTNQNAPPTMCFGSQDYKSRMGNSIKCIPKQYFRQFRTHQLSVDVSGHQTGRVIN